MSDCEYIGDGVYVSFDGYQLELSTQRETTERIYLEPQVYKNLLRYVERLKDRQPHRQAAS